MSNSSLLSLSSLDGRYLNKVIELRDLFSETSLIRHRLLVETLYLIALSQFLAKEKLTKAEEKKLLNWVNQLKPQDFLKVKKIEKEIKHDVKAIEYFLTNNLKRLNLERISYLVHWGLTSEDTNNLAYGLMIQKAKDKVIYPLNLNLIKTLLNLAEKYRQVIMPARTHGQIAVPTTFGKELVVFASRASWFLKKIIGFKLAGKLNGAVGNFNAQIKIFPQKDWIKFSQSFVNQLGLDYSLITTQIEPSSKLVFFLDIIRQLNNVWLDLAKDCWLYISYDDLTQKINQKEVGSSTMPHKVNPINFENAEGNLEIANSLLIMLSNKLPISRMQRDLSDSTVKRNIGLSLGHSTLAIKSLLSGLEKIKPNKNYLLKQVNDHPEMLTEGLQLMLKIYGQSQAYEKIKQQSRGKKIVWQDLISSLNLPQKNILNSWKPENYIGLASQLTKIEIEKIKKSLNI